MSNTLFCPRCGSDCDRSNLATLQQGDLKCRVCGFNFTAPITILDAEGMIEKDTIWRFSDEKKK